MKQGRNLSQLSTELARQDANKRDLIADTRTLNFETANGKSRLLLDVGEQKEAYTVADIAHRQIADRLSIPYKYYEKMKEEAPALLDENVNTWFRQQPERRMVRTLDGQARAFLSDRYRRIDNLEIAGAVMPILGTVKGAQLVSCELTETRMYLKVLSRKISMEVKPGDIVQAGVVISNSEVGLGSVRVEPLIYRLVCTNGLIAQDYSQRKYHIGRLNNFDTDSAYELYRDETLAADDQAFLLKVQDTVKAVFDEDKFRSIVSRFKAATDIEITGDPLKAVEVLGERVNLNQAERGSVFRHFLRDGDTSAYGLINAVTRTAQDVSGYDRATDIERLGGGTA